MPSRSAGGGAARSQKASGDAVGAGADLLHRTAGHNPAAGRTAAGAHVDQVIGVADHIQIMLDHHHGGAVADQCLKHPQQGAHIQRVQADGGLIKHKDAVPLGRPISLASFSRCASPPDRLGVSSPRVR